MRLEDQVYFGCAAYSSIHPNRASELNHLFLVIGNGYEWTKRGDLVAVCDDQFYKNGKPMPLNVAINRVFRKRKKNDEFRKRYTRNEKRREKRALTHSKTCTTVTFCNCGSDPHDKFCCCFYPDQRVCNCGAQARIDALKPRDTKLDKLIDDAIEAMRKAKEADPVGYEQKRLKQIEDFKKMKREWRESEKWEYRIPADIDQRVAYQEPRPGAHGGYNHWYPACQYSKIVDFPENIKNDWLLGIIEVCQLVLSNPPVVDMNSTQKTVDTTLELAHAAWERAVKMAAKRGIGGYAKKARQKPPQKHLSMKVGQRVQIAKSVPWSGADAAVASRPSVGLKGKIADPKEYPYPTPPEGKTAVILKSTDLGYEPWDDDHKTMVLYIPTECLKAI